MPSTTPPSYRQERFNCPHCGALSHHDWNSLYWPKNDDGTLVGVMSGLTRVRDQFSVSLCLSCERLAVWHRLDVGPLAARAAAQRARSSLLPSAVTVGEVTVAYGGHRMIWPRSDEAVEPLPEEAPDSVCELWDEARAVAALSPRSAAALLRLALQLLLDELFLGSRSIDSAIATAYANNTPAAIVQAMDFVRVTGNGAVHDAQVQMNEDPDVVPALFALLRYVIDDTVVKVAKAERLFSTLPADKLASIAQRNAKAQRP